jgi:hypothetical protein
MHFINQQLDRRRCFLCAEPITGPTCTRCGHLHDVRSQETFAELLALLRSQRKLPDGPTRRDSDVED